MYVCGIADNMEDRNPRWSVERASDGGRKDGVCVEPGHKSMPVLWRDTQRTRVQWDHDCSLQTNPSCCRCDYIVVFDILTNHFYINTWLFAMEFLYSFQILDLQTMFLQFRCSKNRMLGKCGHCIRADLGHWHWQSCFSWASTGSKLLSCPGLGDLS